MTTPPMASAPTAIGPIEPPLFASNKHEQAGVEEVC
jgi:hypothetical protein